MGQLDDHLEESNLPHVREEIRRIQRFGRSVDVLVNEQANRETFLPYLQHYSWVHFACHGHLVAKEPFLSYFELHDNERLTLADLIKARFSKAEFELAFLSACNSAAVEVNNTPDEVIHLAAALQFCGFRSVVGTLWSMGSAGDFRDSAMALNHATREMRKRRVPMDRWINFVHIGA
jgi:CHAT domain-containing protein